MLDDLVGYEIQKKKLVDNTRAFVEGRKANNCLLFGDSGTGKSTSIKAINTRSSVFTSISLRISPTSSPRSKTEIINSSFTWMIFPLRNLRSSINS